MSELFLIAGLGNPGPRYLRTWHNCGFMALEYLSQKHNIPLRNAKHKALTGRGVIAGQNVLLLCPQTYMNNSGESLAEALRFYKLPPENLLVIYDDLDTPVGRMRMRAGGGPGTHNGMRSILQHLGSDQFPRLRIGIGPKPAGWDLADYVLSEVPKNRQEELFKNLELAAKGVELWLSKGIEAAMNELNRHAKAAERAEKKAAAEARAAAEAAEATPKQEAQE